MSNDVNVDIARIQKEIKDALALKAENIIFDFSQQDGLTKLNLITVNPRHEQSFLFHTVKAIDKLEALQKMQEYVNLQHKEEDTYTVQWRKMDETELHTSYFSAKNIYEALDKFYYDRDLNACTVFSVTLNPVA